MGAQITEFDRLEDGQPIHAVTLRAGQAMLRVLTLGGILQDYRLAEDGPPLLLGAASAAGYLGRMRYAGAIVGPVANRIAGGKVTIDGLDYQLEQNSGPNHLHGGAGGLHGRIWSIVDATAESVTLQTELPDGACGLPGNRRFTVVYRLEQAALTISLRAQTDRPTLMNPVTHPYINLDGGGSIRGQGLQIAADHYLPTGEGSLPTGEVRSVANSVFDLRAGRVLSLDEGYDHNFCLSDAPVPLRPVAWLTARSGLRLTVATTAPGIQVYDGAGFFSEGPVGHGGVTYGAFAGIALEPQHWPDAPSHPGFPSILLTPGETFAQETRLSFDRPAA